MLEGKDPKPHFTELFAPAPGWLLRFTRIGFDFFCWVTSRRILGEKKSGVSLDSTLRDVGRPFHSRRWDRETLLQRMTTPGKLNVVF